MYSTCPHKRITLRIVHHHIYDTTCTAAAELGQHHILVTADLAIYSKAQQILWSKQLPLQGKITMRLGGMHITMAYLASIGKLYGDGGGLFDILTESDVYAEGTARQLLQGKTAGKRGVRSIKLASEAVQALLAIHAIMAWKTRPMCNDWSTRANPTRCTACISW